MPGRTRARAQFVFERVGSAMAPRQTPASSKKAIKRVVQKRPAADVGNTSAPKAKMDIPLARQEENSVQLTATDMSGASIALQAQPSELMRDIKPRIRDAFRIKDDQDIALVCDGQRLDDEHSVSDLRGLIVNIILVYHSSQEEETAGSSEPRYDPSAMEYGNDPVLDYLRRSGETRDEHRERIAGLSTRDLMDARSEY